MGKLADSCWIDAERLYLNKLKHYAHVELMELELPKSKRSSDADQVKRDEAELFQKNLKPGEAYFLTDEHGKTFTSRAWAKWLNDYFVNARSPLNVLIGGAFGYDASLKSGATGLFSFSAMTMNHQLFRVVLLEQMYRAVTILKGEPYHHD